MESETQRDGRGAERSEQAGLRVPQNAPEPLETRDLSWAIIGPDGVRAGWLVLLFYCLFRLFSYVLGPLVYALSPDSFGPDPSPSIAFVSEFVPFFAMLGAGGILLPVAHRRIADYNLRDSRGLRHFLSGLVVGFLALSLLIGLLALGGWARFGHESLQNSKIIAYGFSWGFTFLLVGCVEEGTFRCYALWTLTHGINFWWALAVVSGLCLYACLFVPGKSPTGVYLFALLGLFPCLVVHLKSAQDSGFWQGAWATSTGFAFVHTFNHGENSIGIFAAAFIGFAFCVSIRVTGSAWWAIGCHAAWDWAETYFYGTADSGFVAPGHLLATSPTGNPLWSGGADGPEGSLLIIPIVLLMVAWLLIIYRRPKPGEIPVRSAAEQLAS